MYVFNHAIESYAVTIVILSVCSPSLSTADAVCPPCEGGGGSHRMWSALLLVHTSVLIRHLVPLAIVCYPLSNPFLNFLKNQS